MKESKVYSARLPKLSVSLVVRGEGNVTFPSPLTTKLTISFRRSLREYSIVPYCVSAGSVIEISLEIVTGHSSGGFNEEIIWISIAMSILIGILILIALCYLFREKCKKRREVYVNT